MKTLRDFLLAEAKEEDKDKKKSKKPSSGPPHSMFKDISNVGSITKQAEEFLGGKIKDSKAAAASDAGRQQIRKNLVPKGDPPGGDDPYKILEWLMGKGTKLNDVFGEKTQIKDKFIILKLKGGWENLAGQGKDKSSKKLLKFWVSSALVAYGVSKAWDLGYAMNDADNLMMVYKK